MTRSLIAACTALLLATPLPLSAEPATAPSAPAGISPTAQNILTPDDKEFVEKASQINLTEIEMGNVAKESPNPTVRQLGKQLAEQHTQAQQKLERLAASKGIILPDKPDADHQKKIDALKKQKGEAFTRAYLNANVAGHEQAIALFESATEKTSDGELRVWAEEMIPHLKRHLEAVQRTQPEAVGERTGPGTQSPSNPSNMPNPARPLGD